MYGSLSDEDLNEWERLPSVMRVLCSAQMGAWLLRRDENKEKSEHKMGRWINSRVPESMLCECSVCGFTCGAYSFNYCPSCGANMESEDKECR